MVSFEKIKSMINDSKKIGLSYHISPDGDAIGSLLGLYCSLKSLNKEVEIFSKDNLQNNVSLKFLPHITKIDGKNFNVPDDIDLLIILDCGNLERVSCDFDLYKINTLCIDHHISNDNYCKFNYIDSKSSSTGEIVYSLVKFLGVKITKEISTCIYTSIMTDTGGLRFEYSTPKTFNIVGELVSTGFDFWNIYEKIFLSQTYSKVKLLGLVFDKLKLVDEKICVIRLTEDMFEKSGANDEQTNDVVSQGLTIENVKVSILTKVFRDKIKVSLRSKDDINVCEVAQKFGGGGHIKAAAFVTDHTMDEIEEILISEFRKLLK